MIDVSKFDGKIMKSVPILMKATGTRQVGHTFTAFWCCFFLCGEYKTKTSYPVKAPAPVNIRREGYCSIISDIPVQQIVPLTGPGDLRSSIRLFLC